MAKVIMNISFISENQIEQLLTEAGFTNVTRFYATGFFLRAGFAMRKNNNQ